MGRAVVLRLSAAATNCGLSRIDVGLILERGEEHEYNGPAISVTTSNMAA